jgi:cell division GTPase FtsZ
LVFDPTMQDEVRVTVVATGYDKPGAPIGIQTAAPSFNTTGGHSHLPPAAPPRTAPPRLKSDDVDIDVPTFQRRGNAG